MKKKIIGIFIFFFVCITVMFLSILNNKNLENKDKEIRNQIVSLNEIQELTKMTLEDSSKAIELEKAIENFQQDIRSNFIGIDTGYGEKLWIIYGLCVLFLIIVFLYIYIQVIRPFIKLQSFATQIAKGDFDLPLYIERNNMFGDFTWAFDMMRKEVKRARLCEKEAIENNKIVIATISHDIKTPIASIRAYTEGLQANMDNNYERKQRYISVIIKKCDEVSKLTNDLFLHSLSNIEKLEINIDEYKAPQIINEILKSILAEENKLVVECKIPDCIVKVDKNRLEQVFENIISNSVKYSSGSKINIDFKIEGKYLYCTIKDFGQGILDEDMPFIFEKFYRGKNIENKPGAGLGLYIVKYIMEQMEGKVEIENRRDGLTVILKIKRS
ncbi:HAMP domain-containing histidine kinase [Clostridium gasigenes]|uniref:HAMP domain-containing sensor histidine kinase n=1 Tax=Clostridium gasigenes TaxID=94869 RepID=UPI0014384F80|nr:HAMP domain-containing sensor histidine kinase [Clostridium gasigenes]NKF07168.1 HAMP domain-containing histidine kinase [Clostridium gasigenes]QSW18151.1 HAMP domain-containing histidine kinase [Clostridium gasigenes]